MKEFHGVFSSLPAGSVQPRGWLREWARANAEGWLLDYAREEDPRVYGRLWNRLSTAEIRMNANGEWLDPPDYNAYFADALLRYAHYFPGTELARIAAAWTDRALACQDADGYIGAFVPEARWRHWLEVFAQSVVLEALLFRWETTRDARILDAVERCAMCQIKAWSAPGTVKRIFATHGTITVRLMASLHRCTGNRRYIVFAEEVLAAFGKASLYLDPGQKAWYTAPGDALVGEHVVMETEHVGFPAILYERTGMRDLLAASRAAWDMMVRHHLSIGGTPNGNEAMFRVGPRENSEHCAAIEWIITSASLARITGAAQYADAAERCFYNAYPAAKSPDGMTVAYMHAPNQLTAAEWGSSTFYDNVEACCRQHYHSAQDPLCCNSNSPRGIPWFVDSMIMRSDDGLAVALYGPCEGSTTLQDGSRIGIEVDTMFPFEDKVCLRIGVDGTRSFPLQVRIPGWAGVASLSLNGSSIPLIKNEDGFAEVKRPWKDGDVLTLQFAPEIICEELRRSEFGIRACGIAFRRGPLTFSLPVGEAWMRFTPPGSAPTQAPERIVAWRVLPSKAAVWNYAVARPGSQETESAPTLVRLDVPRNARPWEHAPVGLRVRARRVLNWQMEGTPDHPMTPGLPYVPMHLSEMTEDVTLVPYGSTHLRLTYLPCFDG